MKKNSSYWYCPKCKEELDGCHVTYQELCEYCGTAVLSVSENISQGKLEEIIEAEAEAGILLDISNRLAAYEDSGLSPEEVQKLNKSDASKEQCTIDQHGEIHRLRDELKRYKQAEQEGRLVVLPCKVGDAVYEPFAGKVYEKTVDRIIINRFTTPQIWIETKLPFAAPRLERWDMAIGKTVFLSREAAEKALGGGE